MHPIPRTLRPLVGLAVLLALLAVPALSAAPRPPALALGESRPLETTLGNPALPAAQAVWLEMIDGATKTLDLEHFYFSHRPGESLQPVVDAIGRAAARGVQVRLLLDAAMSRTYPRPADSLAALPNVKVRRVDYHRLAGGVQHAKFMITDGTDGWLGSQNLDWRAMTHIHELGIRMRDPRITAAMEAVFAADWDAADTTGEHHAPARYAGSWPVRVTQADGHGAEATLAASPRSTTPAGIPWDRDLVVQRITGAKRTLVAQVLQYGVRQRGGADSTLHKALIAAAARGVAVRLIVSDWSLGGANEPAMRDLAAHGVQVKISRVPDWSGGYIPFARVEHCKYMVADGEWIWVGTSNWEPSYFLETRNLGLTVHDPALAAQGQAIFEASWNAPTAAPYGPDTQLPPRTHGETAPAGMTVYGE